jgi:hypothetical protein
LQGIELLEVSSSKAMQFKIRKSININFEVIDRATFIYRIINAAMNLREAKV